MRVKEYEEYEKNLAQTLVPLIKYFNNVLDFIKMFTHTMKLSNGS